MFSLLSLLSQVGTKFKHMYTANTSVCSRISQLFSILLRDTTDRARGKTDENICLVGTELLDERLCFKNVLQYAKKCRCVGSVSNVITTQMKEKIIEKFINVVVVKFLKMVKVSSKFVIKTREIINLG